MPYGCYNFNFSTQAKSAPQVFRALDQVGEWLSLVEHLVRDQCILALPLQSSVYGDFLQF
jgi:hypothetical protein